MYERNGMGAGLAVMWALIMGVNGYNIGHSVATDSEHDAANARVEAVQTYNAELQHQLAAEQAGHVVRLVLDDEANSFSFDTTGPQGQAETCRGSYDTNDNDVAVATGRLACTEVSPIGR